MAIFLFYLPAVLLPCGDHAGNMQGQQKDQPTAIIRRDYHVVCRRVVEKICFGFNHSAYNHVPPKKYKIKKQLIPFINRQRVFS